jgi:hypothetical protein
VRKKTEMGMSLSVKTFYGYVWEDVDDQPDYVDIDDFAKGVALQRGLVDPWVGRPMSVSHVDWANQYREEIDAWYAALRGIKAEIGVDWGHFGMLNDGYSQLYLAVNVTKRSAEWGPLAISDMPDSDRSNYQRMLDEFLMDQELESPTGDNQPGWWTVASYG